MENIRQRFMNEIAARLAGAAESDAKSEMIEELADNLAGRYADMTAAGTDEAEAFRRAMEELGDVDELTAYLNSLEGESPGPDGVEELLHAVEDMGRTVEELGRKAASRTKDFLRSDAARSAVAEGKKSVYKARDFLKKVAEQGAVALSSLSVKVDLQEDGEGEQGIPSEGLMSLDVGLPNGDVDIRLGPEEDGPVRIEGDVDRLEVYTSQEGVLTVRQRYTASGQYLSFRGVSGADVSLTVPARHWESIRAATTRGDIAIGGGLSVEKLDLRTASGDVDCRIDACARAEIKTASGDIGCRGNWGSLLAETASGDVDLEGLNGEVSVSTVSGDVDLGGAVDSARVRSMSGDIQVKSGKLPQALDLSSKSGDVDVRLPAEEGPFHARLDTVSGKARYEFPREWTSPSGAGAGVPQYTLASISGDVSLKKLQ